MILNKGLQLNQFRTKDIVIFPLSKEDADELETLCRNSRLVETLGNMPKIKAAKSKLADIGISSNDVIAVGNSSEVSAENLSKIMPRKSAYGSNYFCHSIGRYGTQNVELHSCSKDAFTCVLKVLHNPEYILIIELPIGNSYDYRKYSGF